MKIIQRRKEILDFVQKTREFDDPIPAEFLSREEIVDRGARKVWSLIFARPFDLTEWIMTWLNEECASSPLVRREHWLIVDFYS